MNRYLLRTLGAAALPSVLALLFCGLVWLFLWLLSH